MQVKVKPPPMDAVADADPASDLSDAVDDVGDDDLDTDEDEVFEHTLEHVAAAGAPDFVAGDPSLSSALPPGWVRDMPDPGPSVPKARNAGGRLDSGFRPHTAIERNFCKQPLGAFDTIFTQGMVDYIVERTNPHLQEAGMQVLTREEFYAFLAMVITKGIKHQPTERSYSNTEYFGT